MPLLVTIVLLAVVWSIGFAPEARAQTPVKIGFLAPLSGAIAQAGKDMYSGCELYWELQNTVIYTYPAVSQFWKYNPEEFLKQPVYSRDFPPCRHC